MQSYFSNKKQPFATADCPIFGAEVASTFNEALLIDRMLKDIKDDKVRLSLLGSYLENIKGTLLRQAQFAEFELRTHEMAEKGEPLTGDALSALYYDITKFLSAGGSDYPIALLKEAGVDMTTREPLRLTVQKMNRVMDEMEKILDAR